MAHVTIDLPVVNQPNATEEPKIPAALAIVRDEFNGNIDNTNLKTGAGLSLSKLAAGSAGQLLVCNASGVPTYVTPTGDVTVSSSGVMTIGAGEVTNAMLAGSITDAKLATPNNAVYRTLFQATSPLFADSAAGTYALTNGGQYANASPVDIGTDTAHADGGGGSVSFFRYVSTQYDVTGLNTKAQLQTQVGTNATASGINFTFGLYPVTCAGTANVIRIVLGTVVTGSTALHSTPAASGISNAGSADFDLTTNEYVIGCVTSGTLANNSSVVLSAQLKLRHTA